MAITISCEAELRCIHLIEKTFSKDDITNVDRAVLEKLVVDIYDILDVDLYGPSSSVYNDDEPEVIEERRKMFANY